MSQILVIGAGAFGGWTALSLLRRGASVTLLDAWGPGHTRASSGGETRIIRATYGSRTVYTRMAARAMELWRDYDATWSAGLFRQTGALWMSGTSEAFARASEAALIDVGLPVEWMSTADASRRFPQISFEGIASALYEPEAGYLHARRACGHVVDRVVAEGGAYRVGAAAPITNRSGDVAHIELRDGSVLAADAYVFACGPWLGTLFPDVIGSLITATRQETFYFGTPPGDPAFGDTNLPAWLEVGDRVMYGIPGNAHRGFKIADDTPGSPIDPTTGDRSGTAANLESARAYLRRRFPRLADAPCLGAEVCQYEATPDSDFILDRHPHASNIWIAGGGSGHGFKMGPAIGEIMASAVLDDIAPDQLFRLGRFARQPKAHEKWA
ncbi:MAG: FAD-dependent oxidoreductase [Phycisphaerales bacterium]|jgi:monomeric sarcosine oxidase